MLFYFNTSNVSFFYSIFVDQVRVKPKLIYANIIEYYLVKNTYPMGLQITAYLFGHKMMVAERAIFLVTTPDGSNGSNFPHPLSRNPIILPCNVNKPQRRYRVFTLLLLLKV